MHNDLGNLCIVNGKMKISQSFHFRQKNFKTLFFLFHYLQALVNTILITFTNFI